jgi:hypothetical protein
VSVTGIRAAPGAWWYLSYLRLLSHSWLLLQTLHVLHVSHAACLCKLAGAQGCCSWLSSCSQDDCEER